MGIFISVEKTIECVIVALFFAAALLACSTKIFGALQSCGYSCKKFLHWSGKKGNMLWQRLGLFATCCLLLACVFGLCFSFAGEYAAVISLAAYVIFFILYIAADKKIALKCPAARTARFKRLQVVTFTVLFVAAYIVITLLNFAAEVWGNQIYSCLRYAPLAVLAVLLPLIICLSNLIAKIYETPHNRALVNKAKNSLAAADIITVGITGSYGKTGVKNILAELLKPKYRVLSTPRSYNTPLGIATAVNGANLADYDVFIAEMGARDVGDIAELCDICPPDYSLITGICAQHLQSFGSVENIIKAKGEILQATKNKAFIADDCFENFAYSGVAESCGCVSDIKATRGGVSFTLNLGGESAKVTSRLLGVHAANNIGLAARLAYEMGVSFADICGAIEKLDYTPHRLQLIENNGVNIIDDGYNSNIKGAAAAVDVLRLFGGKKVCVTPGLIELGVLEESENFELGKNLAGLDMVILVGETLVNSVNDGYLAAGGDEEKIVKVPSLEKSKDILKGFLQSGDAVLFLNDLPDVY